jgi:hypothetical protein
MKKNFILLAIVFTVLFIFTNCSETVYTENTKYQLMPNVCSSTTNIYIHENNNWDLIVKIADNFGKEYYNAVYSKEFVNNRRYLSIDINFLPIGSYRCILKDGNTATILPFIVSR